MDNLHNWESKFESCYYSNRLLDKLILRNNSASRVVDITEIRKAIFYAKKYHGNQMRQSGDPYYSHPLEVAYMVSDYLFRTDIIVTSILHDTIEDTELTSQMIALIFGEKVAGQVMDLTRVQSGEHRTSSAEMVESLWLAKKYDMLLIKQFDRLHNMQTIQAKSPEKIKKITEETVGTFLLLAAYLGTQERAEELRQLCAKIIAPHKYHLHSARTFISEGFQLPALEM
jgi:(p)ppGpp synthase/HD superfamily hydrolase